MMCNCINELLKHMTETESDATDNKKTMGATLGANNHSDKDREEHDYYATHPEATRLFFETIKDSDIILHKDIWECACGELHMTNVLKEYGFSVRSSDLIKRTENIEQLDFLSATEAWHGDIMTNPPFKYAEEFVEKAMDLLNDGNKLILFLKIQFLESQSRYLLFEKYKPKYVYVNSSRQLCSHNGEFDKYTARTVCYCWFIWEKGFDGETIVRWIK